MEKLMKLVTKWSIQAFMKHLGKSAYSLYELEDKVFESFQPVQQQVLERQDKV